MKELKKIEPKDMYYNSFEYVDTSAKVSSINLNKEKEFIDKHDSLIKSNKKGLYRGCGEVEIVLSKTEKSKFKVIDLLYLEEKKTNDYNNNYYFLKGMASCWTVCII